MQVIQLEEAFGLEHLALRSRSTPSIGPHDVLVSMRAASLNSRDYLTVTGRYNPRQQLPLIPCSDGAGEVISVGGSVTRFGPGDRVMPCFAQGWEAGPLTNVFKDITLGGPLDGTLAEFMAIPENSLVGTPDFLSDLEAATLPCAALTAWSAVAKRGKVKAGDTVLIEGTGGVAIFALQFSVARGARVIVTSKSDEKLDKARQLGAAETINYVVEPDWHRRAKDLTDGVGVDLLVELGGKSTLEQAVRAVRASGQICLIGVLGGPVANLNLPLVVMRNVRLQGVTVGSRSDFEQMLEDLEMNRIRPVVDRVFGLAETARAFEYLASGEHFGKVCIRHRREAASGRMEGPDG